MSLRPGQVLRSFLLALCLLSLTDCSGDVGIVVAVENWPSSSPYLLIDTAVNGTPGQQLRIPAGQLRFVVRLPAGQTGELGLTASAIDETGCKVAAGQLTAALERGLRRTTEGSLSLSPVQPALCPITINLPSGGGRVESSPPGLTCSSDSLCRGEFPRLTTLKLTPIPKSYRYYADWQSECSGNRECIIIADKDYSLILQFKAYECSSDGWCRRLAKLGATPVTATLRTLQIAQNGNTWIAGNNNLTENGTIIHCDSLSCNSISLPNTKANRFVQSAILGDYFFSSNENHEISGCQESGCISTKNFYNTSPYICGTYVTIKEEMRLLADAGYLWFHGTLGSGDNTKIFRLSHSAGRIQQCEIAYTVPGGTAATIGDFYVKDGNLWVVDGTGEAHGATCGASLPCVEQNLKVTVSGVRAVAGYGTEVWFAGSAGLRRCNNTSVTCDSTVRTIPNIGMSPNLTVTSGSVWTAHGDYVGLLSGYQSTVGISLARSLPGIPMPADGRLNSQWFWGDDKGLFLAAPGYFKLERCETATCQPQNLPLLGANPSQIQAISSDGLNVWAVGENGTILHYQRPSN